MHDYLILQPILQRINKIDTSRGLTIILTEN